MPPRHKPVKVASKLLQGGRDGKLRFMSIDYRFECLVHPKALNCALTEGLHVVIDTRRSTPDREFWTAYVSVLRPSSSDSTAVLSVGLGSFLRPMAEDIAEGERRALASGGKPRPEEDVL